MSISTLNWRSLKPIKINNIRLTFSWGSDASNKTICCRIDIRLFVNGIPTSYGVNLTRWELIHLGGFISEKFNMPTPQIKTFYELTLESSNEGLLLTKRKGRLFIKNDELPKIEMFIPGLNYIACLMKPENLINKNERSFEDAFIYSCLLKSEILSIDQSPPEEEIIKNNKLSADNLKYLKQNCNKMWECYSKNFNDSAISSSPITRNDFLLKSSGEFIKSVREIHSDCPALLRSLTLVIKSITE